LARVIVQTNPSFINHAGKYNNPDGVITISPSGFENSDFFILPVQDFNFLSFNVIDKNLAHFAATFQTSIDFFKTPNKATNTVEFFGNGFTYTALGLAGGTITSMNVNVEGNASYSISDVSLPVSQMSAWAFRLDDARVTEYFATLLGGDDTIAGSDNDDRFSAGDGNDLLIGNGGADQLDGGAGDDTVVTGLVRRQAVIAISNMNGTVVGPGVADTLTSIERIGFVDGTMYYDASSPAAQIERLYQAALGRTPDPGGLASWVTALKTGGSLNQIAASFIGSAEFQARFPGVSQDSGALVTQLYANVLHRAPDSGGLAFWVGTLQNGGQTQAQVLVSFSESSENQGNTAGSLADGVWVADEQAASVARLYYSALNRAPDAGGLTFWTNGIKNSSQTLAQEAAAFVGSAEFLQKYGNLTNADFVSLIYQNVLGRQADSGGAAFWTGALNTESMSRAGALIGFSESPEHQVLLSPRIESSGVILA
jgi:Ca2+-binding RTX toxin-like protein